MEAFIYENNNISYVDSRIILVLVLLILFYYLKCGSPIKEPWNDNDYEYINEGTNVSNSLSKPTNSNMKIVSTNAEIDTEPTMSEIVSTNKIINKQKSITERKEAFTRARGRREEEEEEKMRENRRFFKRGRGRREKKRLIEQEEEERRKDAFERGRGRRKDAFERRKDTNSVNSLSDKNNDDIYLLLRRHKIRTAEALNEILAAQVNHDKLYRSNQRILNELNAKKLRLDKLEEIEEKYT